MPDYLVKLAWSYIKSKLEAESDYRVKPYDNDLNNILDWKSLQYFGVRREILAEFENPQVLINTSSMLKVYNACDRVEYAAGNISANSKELTIVGGTSTEPGNSWVYWNLPKAANKVYVRATLNAIDHDIIIDLCNGDGSTLSNPPDFYSLELVPETFIDRDLQLTKTIAGTRTIIDDPLISLSRNKYYTLEFYCAIGSVQKSWLDGSIVNEGGDTEITSIWSVRFRVYDNSDTTAQTSKVKGPVVIIYE